MKRLILILLLISGLYSCSKRVAGSNYHNVVIINGEVFLTDFKKVKK